MSTDLKNLLQEIQKSYELTAFFKRIWAEDSLYADIFFLHREQLFPFGDKLIFPYLFWTNVLEGDLERSVLDVSYELEEIKRERAWNRLGFEKLQDALKDLFAYYAIRVIRENEDIRKLILEEDFSFRKMKQVLKDYSSINFDVLKDKEIEEIPELENVLKTNLLGYVKQFDFLRFIEVLSSIAGITSTLPLMAIPHQSKLLELVEIELEDYRDILIELYILKLITNFQTLFWCENCIDAPQIFYTTSRIDPQRLKMRCLKCKKLMLVSSIYSIHDLLRRCILFKDGLLTVALGWLLDQQKMKWEYSVHNKYENDFICETNKGKVLLECKMRFLPKDTRSFESSLHQDLIQLIRHIEALHEEGIDLAESYLIYNYDLEPYSQEIERKIKKYNIKPIGYPEVKTVLGIV
jgi:hypothetical protein